MVTVADGLAVVLAAGLRTREWAGRARIDDDERARQFFDVDVAGHPAVGDLERFDAMGEGVERRANLDAEPQACRRVQCGIEGERVTRREDEIAVRERQELPAHADRGGSRARARRLGERRRAAEQYRKGGRSRLHGETLNVHCGERYCLFQPK